MQRPAVVTYNKRMAINVCMDIIRCHLPSINISYCRMRLLFRSLDLEHLMLILIDYPPNSSSLSL